jgi:hypothetical protein
MEKATHKRKVAKASHPHFNPKPMRTTEMKKYALLK